MTKTIKISNYVPKNIKNKIKNTETILENIYSKFTSEDNTNNLECAIKCLGSKYLFIPSTCKLWDGRYVRLIDTKNPMNMKLTSGGFLVDDNGYTIKLVYNDKIKLFNKRRYITFMLPNDRDILINNLRNI